MIRKDIFKELGRLKPSLYHSEVNFSSTFIIPIPHNVHKLNNSKDIESFFETVHKHWDIKNIAIENTLGLWDIKKYIKKNIFEPLVIFNSKRIKEDFIYEKKNILLSNKDSKNNKNIEFEFEFQHRVNGESVQKKLQLILKEIDLWIMDGSIAFFAYKIELSKDNIYDVNTISTQLNRNLRDYKNLSIDLHSKKVFHNSKKGMDLIEYFMRLTMNQDKKSFLNVVYQDKKFDVDSDLEVINDSTFYAKTITALHVKEDSVKVQSQVFAITPIAEELSESASVNIGILEELSYLLGTTSSYDFDEELAYVAYAGYVYPIIKDNGINIWKFWSGIALQDSVAFFSIDQGGSGIVYNSKTSNYFLYVINLYVSIRLKYIENYLIDKDFLNIDRILQSVQEVQVLKNHYIASEISLRFQPNHINEKINLGLKNHELLNEIEDNLAKTLELTKYNTGMVVSIVAGLITFSGVWLNGDLITELYTNHPYVTSITGIFFILGLSIAVHNKSSVLKFVTKKIVQLKRLLTR